MEISPFWSILVPVAGAVLVALIKEAGDRPRNAIAVGTTIITFALVAGAFPAVMRGETFSFTLFQISRGLSIAFTVEPLGMIFAFLASMLWVFSMIYSTGYMSHEHHRRRYFTFYTVALSATMGVAFSANLFTLYIFYEYLALITYPLVIHSQTEEAYSAGTKYIIYCFSSGALVFLGMFSLGGLVESLTFTPTGVLFPAAADHRLLLSVMFFALVAGFGVKAAIMPLHSWLPSAMVAPTPVSALLHAVAIVKTGVFGVMRVMFYLFGVETLSGLGVANLLAAVLVATILIASILAIKQEKLKSRLAYSTIGQLGYITLGAAMLSPLGVTGGVVHIINHALLKIVLFFCAGAIMTQTGVKYIHEMKGVGKRMPYTMLFFTLAAIGLIGVLPMAGYISKLYLLSGSLQAGKPILGFVLLVSAVLNSIYYFPIIIAAYFQEGTFEAPRGLESPPSMFIPTAVLMVFGLLFGLFAHYTSLPIVNRVVAAIFQL
jgi:multicomponent Na+:H+ antiporter subunit D